MHDFNYHMNKYKCIGYKISYQAISVIKATEEIEEYIIFNMYLMFTVDSFLSKFILVCTMPLNRIVRLRILILILTNYNYTITYV